MQRRTYLKQNAPLSLVYTVLLVRVKVFQCTRIHVPQLLFAKKNNLHYSIAQLFHNEEHCSVANKL